MTSIVKVNCPKKEVKTCNRCGKLKPWVEFNRRKASPICGRQGHCKVCDKKWGVAYGRVRPKKHVPTKLVGSARSRTKTLERQGVLVRPAVCEDCGVGPVEVHHLNYGRPDLVVYVCRTHHEMVHWYERHKEPHPDDDQELHTILRLIQ